MIPCHPVLTVARSTVSSAHLLPLSFDCKLIASDADLKRELISQRVHSEIKELNSPTALRHFGAPFRAHDSSPTPVSATESSLPILRHVFANYVRNFPFLDQAKEEEFWQNKVQVFLEAFASKHVSSSEDRQEETKRRKIAIKSAKLLELMMGIGIPTSSGYEEEVRFSDIEIVERGANNVGLLVNAPDSVVINGWDVNVAGVRTLTTKRMMKTYRHAVSWRMRLLSPPPSAVFWVTD